MEKAILLAVAASFCTATASIAQRQGARQVGTTSGFDVGLIFRLARHPVWLLGIVSMILGFGFQLMALRFGALALVQPIMALELLLVFGYMAFAGRRRLRIKRRDWLAAAAMSAGVAAFLALASPSGGRLHAPGQAWLLAGLVTLGIVLLAVATSFRPGSRAAVSSSRRAAVLGAATGISWGFVAAVIKELSSHIGAGPGAVFSTWSPYLLLAAGAAAMLLASHALAAGPLAASQPGFTVLDPLTAILLGVFLFGEHIRGGPWEMAAEAASLGLVVAGAVALSHSCFILGEVGDPECLPPQSLPGGQGKKLPRLVLDYRPAGVSAGHAASSQPAQPEPGTNEAADVAPTTARLTRRPSVTGVTIPAVGYLQAETRQPTADAADAPSGLTRSRVRLRAGVAEEPGQSLATASCVAFVSIASRSRTA
jgi:drug/metabolite transporter (DMT)-like permease